MSRRAALLAALSCLAVLGVAASPTFDAEAEELFLSTFTADQEPRLAVRTRRLAGYATGGYGGGYGGYGSGAYGSGGYSYGGPSPSPSPSPSLSPSPSSSPSADPSPSTDPTDPSPSSSPSASPSQSASPSPSPTPVNQQDTSLPVCQGVAYDGYLTSCTVWSDTSGDGIQGASEPSAAITAGQFAFATGTAASGLGVLYIRTADEATKMVASGSAVCHDATTLLAVHFPYAAPRPSSCSAKLVISPLTTLLTYTSGLTPAALLEAVNLPTTFPLLTKDSLAAAAAGDSDSQRVYRREVQVQQVVLVGAKLLTGNSSYHPTARKALLRSLANIVAPTSAGRRLLADAAVESLDLTSGALVAQLVQMANQLAAASIPSAELTTLSSAMLEAVANSIAAMNSLIETSTSVEMVAKASVASETVLSDNIQKLAAGEISLEAFQAATSVSALQDAVRQATLPGAPLPSSTTAAEKKSVRAVALGVGLGIGLGVPALAGAAAAAYWVWWKPAHTASRLTRPML